MLPASVQKRTSGKSTQNAFMFKPYRKLAKLSLNRARLSCMSWKCIMLASRSATASDSSANAGSKVLSGNEAESPCTLLRAESRNEDREDGRSGVVGREREVERGRRCELCGCWSSGAISMRNWTLRSRRLLVVVVVWCCWCCLFASCPIRQGPHVNELAVAPAVAFGFPGAS